MMCTCWTHLKTISFLQCNIDSQVKNFPISWVDSEGCQVGLPV